MSLAAEAIDSAAAYRRGVVLVLLAGTCWSLMGIGIRLIEEANVWQILFYRSLALIPFLAVVIALRSRGRLVRTVRAAGLSGVIGGAGLVIAFSGGIYAIQTTSVANAMFLFAAAPFIASLLGLWLLGEAVRRATWFAMLLALVGIVIMVYGSFSLGHWQGNLFALCSATGFAVFTVALRWKRAEDMMPAVLLGGIFALCVSGLVCLVTGLPFASPAWDIGIALAMGIVQVGLGLVLYTVGSKSVPAGELALLCMTEVVLAPVWVWLLLGETAAATTLIGGGVLLAALAGNAISGLRRKPPPVALG